MLDTVLPYILDQMGADNEQNANYLTGLFLGVCGIGMIFSAVVILPQLKKCLNDVQILIVGSVTMAFAMFLFACLSWIPHISIMVISALAISIGMIAFPAANGILTEHLNKNEQGFKNIIFFLTSENMILNQKSWENSKSDLRI